MSNGDSNSNSTLNKNTLAIIVGILTGTLGLGTGGLTFQHLNQSEKQNVENVLVKKFDKLTEQVTQMNTNIALIQQDIRNRKETSNKIETRISELEKWKYEITPYIKMPK